MLPTLDNFVSFGADVFKARPDYTQMLLDIYSTSLISEHLGESDRVDACRLAESVLLNLRGHVDNSLQPIVATALAHSEQASTNALRLAILEVLINAVLYNPSAALHILESHGPGTARAFFDQWFAAINGEDKLPRVHDKKLTIITLSALLEMDPAGIPDNLKEGWQGMVGGALKIFTELPAAIESQSNHLSYFVLWLKGSLSGQSSRPSRRKRRVMTILRVPNSSDSSTWTTTMVCPIPSSHLAFVALTLHDR
jgi:hypothetical protein